MIRFYVARGGVVEDVLRWTELLRIYL